LLHDLIDFQQLHNEFDEYQQCINDLDEHIATVRNECGVDMADRLHQQVQLVHVCVYICD
jgi:hypothetical protein